MTATTAVKEKRREYWFDNAKFFSLQASSWFTSYRRKGGELTHQSGILRSIYIFFMLINMPLFSLISGYFSKSDLGAVEMRKTIANIVVPYLIFETIAAFAGGKYNTTVPFFEPFFVYWYLMTLFIWKLILPLFMQLRFPMLTAIVLSLAVGYVDAVGDFLALSRMFFFFPFFLAGFIYKGKLEVARVPAIVPPLILLGSLLAIIFLSPKETQWILGNKSYALAGLPLWYAWIFRLMHYAASLALGLSFLFLVTKGRTWFSTVGERSIYPFLTHPFIIAILMAFGVYNHPPAIISGILLMIGGVATALILSSAIVCRFFRPLVQPNVNWLLKSV